MARDPHRFVNELNDEAIERLIARLESRATDEVFTGLIGKYIARLELSRPCRVLEVGCGTGAVLRMLARSEDFAGEVVGVDQSSAFVDAASRFAQRDNVDGHVRFATGDAHDLAFGDGEFDVVIANTLISHVTEPMAVLREMARVARPGGNVVIFDGDYASLTYAYPDHAAGARMDEALAHATFNNPRIMRDLPRYFPSIGLRIDEAWGDAVVEIGEASYFRSFAETYVPYVRDGGLLPTREVDDWYQAQQEAMAEGTFFAACNYYSYLLRRLSHS